MSEHNELAAPVAAKDIAKIEIEKYHQKNYWNLLPAGRVVEWVYTAVAENIMSQMQEEINQLKTDLQKTNKKG